MAYTAEEYAADCEYWSCLHRDAYGFRPRGPVPSMADMPARAAAAQRALEQGLDMERRGNMLAQQRYEHNVRYLMMRDGLTRAEAARSEQNRVLRVPQGTAASPHYDAGMVCYQLGLCYGLEHQMQADYDGTLPLAA